MNKKRHTKAYWWVLAVLLCIAAVVAMNAVETKGQTLDQKVYLPLILRTEATPVPTPTLPPWPTPTPIPTSTPIPTHCSLSVGNYAAEMGLLYYRVSGTGIGWKMYSPHEYLKSSSYGRFTSGAYVWYAESQSCGSASGTEFFPINTAHGQRFVHEFGCYGRRQLTSELRCYLYKVQIPCPTPTS